MAGSYRCPSRRMGQPVLCSPPSPGHRYRYSHVIHMAHSVIPRSEGLSTGLSTAASTGSGNELTSGPRVMPGLAGSGLGRGAESGYSGFEEGQRAVVRVQFGQNA